MLAVDPDHITHLVHFVPLGVDGLVDDFALKQLRTDLDDSIRVGLAFNQPSEELVFTQQVLGLDEVDPQDALMRDGEQREKNKSGPGQERDRSLKASAGEEKKH